MKSILKRLLYIITVVPLFIICTILHIVIVFVLVLIYPCYWIMTGKSLKFDDLLNGYLMVDPVIWLTDKLIGDE